MLLILQERGKANSINTFNIINIKKASISENSKQKILLKLQDCSSILISTKLT